jgi:transcriptional regulator with XRE-family HTH domain
MVGNRIRELRERKGWSQERLGDAVGTSRQQIHKLERSERRLAAEWIERIALALDVQPGEIFLSKASDMVAYKKRPQSEGSEELLQNARIKELDVKVGAGNAAEPDFVVRRSSDGNTTLTEPVIGKWSMPLSYINKFTATNVDSIRIIEVVGDSMEPTLCSGDRIMIDLNNKTPSPSGVFALWDGLALVVKRVEYILGSDPYQIMVISDNKHHNSYRAFLSEVSIIGRVVWFARAM